MLPVSSPSDGESMAAELMRQPLLPIASLYLSQNRNPSVKSYCMLVTFLWSSWPLHVCGARGSAPRA